MRHVIWNCVRLPRILCYLFACTYKLVLVLRCQRIKHNHKIPFKIFCVSWARNHIFSIKVVKVSYKFHFKHSFFLPHFFHDLRYHPSILGGQNVLLKHYSSLKKNQKDDLHLFPDLLAFWFLGKTALCENRISGTVLMFQLKRNSPTC